MSWLTLAYLSGSGGGEGTIIITGEISMDIHQDKSEIDIANEVSIKTESQYVTIDTDNDTSILTIPNNMDVEVL